MQPGSCDDYPQMFANMRPNLLRGLLGSSYLLILMAILIYLPPLNPGAGFRLPQNLQTDPPSGLFPPNLTSQFVTREETLESHAASGQFTSDGRLMAAWYGGSAEGAYDVSLYTAIAEQPRWSEPREVMDVHLAQSGLTRYVRKIGNPVLFQHSTGRLFLFFVTVSAGGWAGSAINYQISDDDGDSWQPPNRLVTSPFLNISTLVRGPAHEYQDGSIGLPIYHEFLGKFAELLRLDSHGQILSKTRISHGRSSLQPEIAILDQHKAIALLRYAGDFPRRILSTTSEDGGLSWHPPEKTALPNPNAAVALLALNEKTLLVIFNDTEQYRRDLTLARSDDAGRSWKRLYRLEDSRLSPPDHDLQYAYPWLGTQDGAEFHVLYTWNQREIKHIMFNRAWLEEISGGQGIE